LAAAAAAAATPNSAYMWQMLEAEGDDFFQEVLLLLLLLPSGLLPLSAPELTILTTTKHGFQVTWLSSNIAFK
jgi:hypothetical protein